MASVAKRSVFVGLVLVAVAASGVLWPTPTRGQEHASADLGRDLFLARCASCHGDTGRGTDRGPSLAEAGTASVDFQLRTGRMPLGDPTAQTVRKPPEFDEREIAALVAYVGTFTTGPEVPVVDMAGADISEGQQLFINNCAACHGATGRGGAAGPGALAPSLYEAEPIEVAEAMLSGPGEMPRFQLSDEERNAVVAFVTYLQSSDAPGGADIGGIGPVPEGFVGWGVGVAALVGVCVLLGSKRERRDES